eukprot:COSAG02_NODE_12976_length_1465_cov_20.455344_1_plen_67_part_00
MQFLARVGMLDEKRQRLPMDCNREQAVGGKDSNSSLWTNEVSSGIRLDLSDVVEVCQAWEDGLVVL